MPPGGKGKIELYTPYLYVLGGTNYPMFTVTN